MEISNIDEWNKGKENNTDPYGACIYEYAEGWAKVMQAEIKKRGFEKVDYVVMFGIAETSSRELNFLGISGFMKGAAVSILSHCWKHGEELRKWHNKEYGQEGDGVVNPAILTIGG